MKYMKPERENEIIYEKVSSDYERRIIHLNDLMVVICDFSNGPMKNPDPPHSHPHEQITYVAEGELTFFRGDQKFHLLKGNIISIPSGIPHCIQTISSSVKLIDSFTPVRKEFIK